MNRYGRLALRFWEESRPQALQTLEDPTGFFHDLGLQIQTQVDDLAPQMAGRDVPEETYLQKLSRLMTARHLAEEVVMHQLLWHSDPSLTLAEARQEWEETRPNDLNLARWAERIQDAPETMPATEELQEIADHWALSLPFLEALLASSLPETFLDQHPQEMAEAANRRFLREVD